MKRIAIFASGRGSNARRIIEHFSEHPQIEVALVLSNQSDAPVLTMARNFGIDADHFDRSALYDKRVVLDQLNEASIDWIALAGFLWLLPEEWVNAYRGRIVNIHPALLPAYGGKGMYGMNVHRAVKKAGETESGITIHQVNEKYDRGDIVFQARCSLEASNSAEEIASKVLELEHQYYPLVLEQLIIQTNEH